jgi:pimeloyl-ACP methyl ester carboxylesterase
MPPKQPHALPCRSLGAKIALHVAVFHGSSIRKLISVSGSAGGESSSTAVLDAVNLNIPFSERVDKVGALLERPSNIKAVCQWVLVRTSNRADVLVRAARSGFHVWPCVSTYKFASSSLLLHESSVSMDLVLQCQWLLCM